MLDTSANIKRAIDRSVSSGIRSETGPHSASKNDYSLIDFVLLHRPAIVGSLKCCIVHELMGEDVFLTSSQVDFLFLLTRSQMHERVKAGKLVETKATEGFVLLDAAESILSE